MGFDFYAPQTFEDAKGRRILIGWMGLPDVEGEYTNPTAEKEGWQHCLTVPREIRLYNGRLYQYPVEELKVLRGRDFRIDETQENIEVFRPFELEMKLDTRMCRISFGTDLILEADGPKVWLRLSREAGAGRRQRNAILPSGSPERTSYACGYNGSGDLFESRRNCFFHKILSGKNVSDRKTGGMRNSRDIYMS